MWQQMKDKIRGWIGAMFGFIGNADDKEIRDLIETEVSKEHYTFIESWKAIYAGYYDEWHKMQYVTVNGTKKRRRHSLSMAKISVNELAKLIFTENVEINISDTTLDTNIKDLLKKNRFDKVFQSKLEQMFALGGMVLKANPKAQEDGTHKLLISYITPDCFVPISWENEDITEGAFLNISRKDKSIYCLFEVHRWSNKVVEGTLNKQYEITNILFKKDNDLSVPKRVPLIELYPDLEEEVVIQNLTQPLFQYIKTNVANNFDLQSPLGISLFANSLDTLYAIDVAFDSFINEFKLGKRRIIVPSQAVRTVVDPSTGEMHRYFDADDEVYQAMNFADPEKQKITDNTVALRVTEHVAAINSLLNLYAMQIGFSAGTFSFDGTEAVKTATEVISENSKTYQTIKSNCNHLEESLRKFIGTLSEVASLYDIFDLPMNEIEVEFNWDDSVIGDKYTDSDFYIKLIGSGLVSKKYALMKILGLTDVQADEMLAEIKEEFETLTPDLNSLLNAEDPLGGMGDAK